MKQKKDTTSRHWILDAVECIKNCEAIVSHCNEIMDSISENITRDDKVYDKYMVYMEIRERATRVRRNVMRKIYNSFENADHELWCIVKHSIAAKWFLDEVVAADTDNKNLREFDQQDLYKLMSLALSSFIWEKPQLCARCMADDLFYKEGKDD